LVRTLALYLGDVGFKPRPKYKTIWLKVCVAFSQSSRPMSRWYLHSDCDFFLTASDTIVTSTKSVFSKAKNK
jgi:hypothetical protein